MNGQFFAWKNFRDNFCYGTYNVVIVIEVKKLKLFLYCAIKMFKSEVTLYQ